MHSLGLNHFRLLSAAALLLAMGCTPKSTRPGPATLSSSGSGLSFTYLKWDEGLRVLLVDNVPGGRGTTSSSSTSSPVATSTGYAGVESNGYKWQLDTSDGKTATFRLDGTQYDLANGTLFVIKSKDGTNEVSQLKRDLSGIPFQGDECRAALAKDPEITKLLDIEPAK